jgi:hypothetical protein
MQTLVSSYAVMAVGQLYVITVGFQLLVPCTHDVYQQRLMQKSFKGDRGNVALVPSQWRP